MTADLGAALSSGGVAAVGTALTAVVASIASFFAGAELGKKIGGWIFPEDKDLYDKYSGITGTLEMLRDFFVTIGEEIAYAWEDLVNGIKEAWEDFKGFFVDLWNGIVEKVSELWDKIKQKATDAWTAIQGAWQAAAEWFNSTIVQPIVQFFTDLWDGIKQLATDTWDAITGVWEAASEWFNSTVIEPITTFFTDMWEGITGFAQDAWDGICSIFEGAVEWFSEVFQGVSDAIETIMDGLEGIVKKPINAVIRLLNKFIDGLNKIEIPDWVPEVGGKGINIKKINELEQGGVLKRGQVGFLEGNGAEAVVPLEKNKKWIAAVTNDLKKSLKADGMIGQSGGASIIGGNTSNVTFNQYNNSPRALSRLEIYRQTRNQLSLVNNGGLVNA